MPYIGQGAEMELTLRGQHSNETLVVYGRIDALVTDTNNSYTDSGTGVAQVCLSAVLPHLKLEIRTF